MTGIVILLVGLVLSLLVAVNGLVREDSGESVLSMRLGFHVFVMGLISGVADGLTIGWCIWGPK